MNDDEEKSASEIMNEIDENYPKKTDKYAEENNEYLMFIEQENKPSLSKFLDFIYGLLIFGIIDAVITWIVSIILKPLNTNDSAGFGKGITILLTVIIVSYANYAGIKYYKNSRIYIMFGIVSLYIYPLLLFGSCFLK